MDRFILQDLRKWKLNKHRKPLIIKGVRRTGKTYILKKFGESDFFTTHYLNFELTKRQLTFLKGILIPSAS
jgi:predicted AAA+ superfamily ATPase